MKLVLIAFSLVSALAQAAPSNLVCSENIELNLQSNWVRASYIGVKTTSGVTWYDWTGKEPNSMTVKEGGSTLFTGFIINQKYSWWGPPPVIVTEFLFIESALFTGAKEGKVILQTETESRGILVPRHDISVSSRVLNCKVP